MQILSDLTHDRIFGAAHFSIELYSRCRTKNMLENLPEGPKQVHELLG